MLGDSSRFTDEETEAWGDAVPEATLRLHRALVSGLRAELPTPGVCTLPQGEGSSVWMGQEHMAWLVRPAPKQTTLWGDGSGVEHTRVVGNVLLPAWQSGRLPGGGDVAAHPHPEGQSGARQGVRVGREGMASARGSAWGARRALGATGSHHTFLRVRGKLRCVFLKVHSGCHVDSGLEDVRAGLGGGPYQAGTGREALEVGAKPSAPTPPHPQSQGSRPRPHCLPGVHP